ncbi:hypothetical protein HK098_001255 [Nowakowskiella sp. JEL0407]|nr:hypothetical protein HK098_001255 [Nowakowskiella sp. JEL0407]
MEARIKELEFALSQRNPLPNSNTNTSNWDAILNDSYSLPLSNPGDLSTQNQLFALSLDGIQNPLPASAIQFPLLEQISQNALSIFAISPHDDLPYSAEVIDDMIECFFNYCNCWPVNFLQPQWYKKNRYRISKPLLYTLCAISSKYSKYTPMLQSLGHDPGKELFEAAKKCFDATDISLENFMCVLFMSTYLALVGRMREFWIFLNIGISMIGFLKLHIDPDELELITKRPILIIEKECRRRLWWLIREKAIRSEASKFMGRQINVRRPLPTSIFHAISDETPWCREWSALYNAGFDVDNIAFDLHFLAEAIKQFQEKILEEKNWSSDLTPHLVEADELIGRLRHWFELCPHWFHSVLTSTNICINTDQKPYQIPYIALHIYLLYYSLQLMVYRFLYSSFCLFSPELQPPLRRSHECQQAMDLCWKSHNTVMEAYRNKPILLQTSLAGYQYTLGPLLHSIIFTCTMSEFADTPAECEQAIADFHFARKLLVKFMADRSFTWKVVEVYLQDVDRVYCLPAGQERVDETMGLFVIGKRFYESMYDDRVVDGSCL